MKRGFLLVVSGPSGVGKGTLCSILLQRDSDIMYSISATTRAMRTGEEDGVNYFYLTEDEFEMRIENSGFLEYARVHDNLYGTPLEFVQSNISRGKTVLLEIDVQGALQIKRAYPEAVLVFILPPSLNHLRARIEGRNTESIEQIEIRMANAERELSTFGEYEYGIVNNEIERATDDLEAIVRAERLKIDKYDYVKFMEDKNDD